MLRVWKQSLQTRDMQVIILLVSTIFMLVYKYKDMGGHGADRVRGSNALRVLIREAGNPLRSITRVSILW